MRSPPHPRAAWPSGDDNTGFNLIVILLGCCVGAYLLWTSYHGEISAGVMALRHHEIAFIRHFTDRYDLADRQMAAADPNGVTLRDLYGISHAVGMFFRIPAAVFMLLLAAICTVAGRAGALQARLRSRRSDSRAGRVLSDERRFCPPPSAPRPTGWSLSPDRVRGGLSGRPEAGSGGGDRLGTGRAAAGRLRVEPRGVDRPFCDRPRRRL